MKRAGLVALFAILAAGAQSQGNLDSLQRALATAEHTGEEAMANLGLASYYVYHNLDSADYYITQVLGVPDVAQYFPKGYSYHLMVKAWVHQGKGELEKAREYMEQVEAIRKTAGSRYDLLELQINLASVLVQMKSPDAMAYVADCQAALDTAHQADQNAWLFHQYYKGRIYGDQEDYRQAIEALLALLRTPFLDIAPELRGGAANTLGIFLGRLSNAALAVEYGRQAVSNTHTMPHERPLLLLNLAGSFLDLVELDSARHYLAQVAGLGRLEVVDCIAYHYNRIELASLERDPEGMLAAAREGRACSESGLPDPKNAFLFALAEGEAFFQLGDTERAARLLEQAKGLLAANEQLQNSDFQSSVARLGLRLQLAKAGPEASALFEDYNRLRKMELKAASDEKLKEAFAQYETEKKELENQALQRENKLQATINHNQQLGLWGLGLGVCLLGGLAYILYQQRQRVQAQKDQIELLNREQYHRTMNNLAFTNSLMSLQVNRLEGQPEARQALREAESRLHAMSVLYRKLHEGGAQADVGLRSYLAEIVEAIEQSFGSAELPLAISLECPDDKVDGDAAVRIGLIINELATNSCKHAFAGQPAPRITVQLKAEAPGAYQLLYTDNGTGLPADFEISDRRSTGFLLIRSLVQQLKGQLSVSSGAGMRVACQLQM